MSLKIIKKQRKKKDRVPRKRTGKALHRRRVKRNIYRKRSWKLQYPELFKEIPNYPYIIRKNSNGI